MKFSKNDTMMVKGVAILMLLFYHLFYYEPMFLEHQVIFAPFELQQVMKASRVLNVCVSIFLFLSVYGMYKNFESMEAKTGKNITNKQYFWLSIKRFGSLMLGYVAVFLSILMFFFWDLDLKTVYGEGTRGVYFFLMDLTGTSKFFEFPSINASWWYLQLAILIIFCMPFLYVLYKKMGSMFIPFVLFLPYVFSVEYMTERYRYVVLAAMVMGHKDWLVKWKEKCLSNSTVLSGLYKKLIGFFFLSVGIYLRQYEGDLVTEQVFYVAEAIVAISVILLVYDLFGNSIYLKKILCFIGKNSLNMYFSHLFFCYYLIHVRELIFSAKYFWMIYGLQIIVTLGYSCILEQVKKVVRYQKLIDYIRAYCDRRIDRLWG